MTKTQALYALLKDGRWHHMDELRSVAGWRYSSRLYDMKAKLGIEHETRKRNGRWEYRILKGGSK